jgi:hypothetical protein
MMFPRWGTLLTYGSALVMSMLRRPGIGSFGGGGGENAIGTEVNNKLTLVLRRNLHNLLLVES